MSERKYPQVHIDTRNFDGLVIDPPPRIPRILLSQMGLALSLEVGGLGWFVHNDAPTLAYLTLMVVAIVHALLTMVSYRMNHGKDDAQRPG